MLGLRTKSRYVDLSDIFFLINPEPVLAVRLDGERKGIANVMLFVDGRGGGLNCETVGKISC